MITIHTAHVAPSQNACYRNATSGDSKKGRIKTQRYRTWASAAGWDFKLAAGGRSISGPYTITITIDRSKRHPMADVMNTEKVISDLLQELGIIEDDRFCERGTVQWGSADGGMRIELEEYGA